MVEHLNLVIIPSEADNLPQNLRRLMEQKNISEAELARKTNIPQPTLHKILAGKTNDPRAFTLKALADFFDTSIDILLTGSISKPFQSNETQSIAVISWADCIKRDNINLNSNNCIIIEFISKYTYALVSKPSMEPRFPKGSILLIDPMIIPEDGDLVVTHYPNTAEATLRELSIDGPTRLLLPVCRTHTATPYDKKIKILGVLVKSIFSFH